MFSTLRTVVSRQPILVRRALVSTFSPNVESEALTEIAEVLNEVGDEQPEPPKARPLAASGTKDSEYHHFQLTRLEFTLMATPSRTPRNTNKMETILP